MKVVFDDDVFLFFSASPRLLVLAVENNENGEIRVCLNLEQAKKLQRKLAKHIREMEEK